MNPADKGWLKRLIRRQILLEQEAMMSSIQEARQQNLDPQTFLYALIQPTGMMYGFPVRFIGKPHRDAGNWTEKDKIKILLSEVFLYLGAWYHPPASGKLRDSLPLILEDLEHFYQEFSALIPAGSRLRWQRRPDIEDRVEAVIDKRISLRYDWRNFWNSFFHNSLLFFDLIHFVQWKAEEGGSGEQSVLMQRQALRFDILKIIAAAAHSDGHVSQEEKELFQFFLESARLPAHRKRQAEGFFRDGLALSEMNIENVDSWLVKKYFLELAILTVWVNRHLNPEEQIFLRELNEKMGLSEQDLQASMEAIRDFVLQYWDKVHYLTIRQNYRVVSEQMLRRLRTIVKDNQRMLVNEVKGSRDLALLIGKYTTGEASKDEIEQLRVGLLDILKAIPAYSYLLLPGSFLTLPILLRILPKSILFPSSYREEQQEEKKSRQK